MYACTSIYLAPSFASCEAVGGEKEPCLHQILLRPVMWLMIGVNTLLLYYSGLMTDVKCPIVVLRIMVDAKCLYCCTTKFKLSSSLT